MKVSSFEKLVKLKYCPFFIQRIFDHAQRHLVDFKKGPNSHNFFVDVGMFKNY
jgi:hypothetical protein